MDPLKAQNPAPEILNPSPSSSEVISVPKSPESFPSVESKVVDPVAKEIAEKDDPLIAETKALTDLNQVLPIKPKTLAATNPDNGAESLGVDALNKATK
jgi:hypothetical protein